MRRLDFTDVTEHPGDPATSVQMARLQDRYHFAATHTRGGRVLEIACGSGIGLPLLAKHSSYVVGGDIDGRHVRDAARLGLPVVRLDAGRLPFRDGVFDLVFVGEAVYYLPDVEALLNEVARVLATTGRIAITTVNPDWPGWVGSSYSVRYYGHLELARMLRTRGFAVTAYGVFPDAGRNRLVSRARQILSRLGVIPGSLKARAFLKRAAYGRMDPLPSSIEDGVSEGVTWTGLYADESAARFSVLHVLGERRPS